LSSMFPMVMLLLVSTALLMLELFTLPRDPLTLMLSMDTEDTEDMATWVMLDTVVQSHMLTPLDPTSLMLSSMFPMVMLLLVSTALLMLELFTLPRDPLTLTPSTDTDTLDLLHLESPPCPMLASLFRDMLMDMDTDCGRLQDVEIYCLIKAGLIRSECVDG